ncbi:MAG TPA: MerR family transcriptional regulator [bacterium]|jgi:DNA-binding transcriptional MerR regulator
MSLTRLPEDALYSIAQVNAITGVAKPTIRFWEKEFAAFLHPQRTDGNQRRYTRLDIDVIERINYLVRNEGFTLEGARRKLELEVAPDEAAGPPGEDQMEKLADTMSDYLLKKLLAKTTA